MAVLALKSVAHRVETKTSTGVSAPSIGKATRTLRAIKVTPSIAPAGSATMFGPAAVSGIGTRVVLGTR
jgi:hypothetical protein